MNLTDLSEFVLLFLSLDGVTLAMYNSVRSNDTIRRRICLHNLELNSSHSSSHQEQISFSHRSVGFQEVRFQVRVKQVAAG